MENNLSKENASSIYNKVLFDTFKVAIDFLDSNNLRWWGAYGTILGAIRHKGMIPWDDDIDIYMPRDDYNKLFKLRDKLVHTDIDIMSYYDDGYVYSFMKFVNKRTTLWEQKKFPFTSGVYIDIFPIDLTDETDEQIKINHGIYARKLRQMQLVYQKQTLLSFLYSIKNGGLLWLRDYIYAKISPQMAIKKFALYDNSLNKRQGGKYVRYAGSGYMIYQSKWFDSHVEVPYEDFTIKIPSGYHELLTMCYGDYMTPPPIDKRVSGHEHYYLNLKEKLTIDDVKKRIKKGERLVY